MEAMRAVENRVPLERAANTGFSAVVDLDGRVRSQTALYETTFLVAEVAWPQVTSFYTAHGDLFAHLCALATVGLLGDGYVGQRQRDNGKIEGRRDWKRGRGANSERLMAHS